jgi:hypothetical protein
MDDATIKGFANLRWDGAALSLAPRKPGTARAQLAYHLTSLFPLRDLGAVATLEGQAEPDEQVMLSLSADGSRWQKAVWPTPSAAGGGSGAQTLTLSVGDIEGFDGITDLWFRVTLRSGPKTSQTAIRLRNLRVQGVCTPPEEREIRLVPDADGKVAFRDGIASHAIRFTAELDNAGEIQWEDGRIGAHGLSGRGDVVALRQKFVCEKPLRLLRIATRNLASVPDYGSSNALAISLDGKEKLAQKVTEGRFFDRMLELGLGDDPRFGAVREFWVHMEMSNSSTDARTINAISGLEIEAVAAPPESR